MAKIYAMSDIHGQSLPFEEALELVDFSKGNQLVLCGDYIDHRYLNDWIYCDIFDLQKSYPEQVTVLMGNTDYIYLHDFQPFSSIADTKQRKEMKRWLENLPNFYETDNQIFVHAGIDEEAGDFWEFGASDEFFREKFPPTKGHFLKDIIAGHVATSSPYLSNDANYHEVYWDGASHYFLDGTTERSGFVPVLEYDVESGRYFHYPLTEDGAASGKRVRMPVEAPLCFFC